MKKKSILDPMSKVLLPVRSLKMAINVPKIVDIGVFCHFWPLTGKKWQKGQHQQFVRHFLSF